MYDGSHRTPVNRSRGAALNRFVNVTHYFDCRVLLTECTLEPTELRRTIDSTFARRQLQLPDTTPSDLSDAFAQDAVKTAQWNTLLKRSRLQALDLVDGVTQLRGEINKLSHCF